MFSHADSPLFLVNHFVSPPDLAASEEANSLEVIGPRLDRCLNERGLLPNLVAVDFFSSGGGLTWFVLPHTLGQTNESHPNAAEDGVESTSWGTVKTRYR